MDRHSLWKRHPCGGFCLAYRVAVAWLAAGPRAIPRDRLTSKSRRINPCSNAPARTMSSRSGIRSRRVSRNTCLCFHRHLPDTWSQKGNRQHRCRHSRRMRLLCRGRSTIPHSTRARSTSCSSELGMCSTGLPECISHRRSACGGGSKTPWGNTPRRISARPGNTLRAWRTRCRPPRNLAPPDSTGPWGSTPPGRRSASRPGSTPPARRR
jgi:hypothetical protein